MDHSWPTLIGVLRPNGLGKSVYFTLKPLDAAFAKGHGQVERDIVLMVAHHLEELKLELVQRLPKGGGR